MTVQKRRKMDTMNDHVESVLLRSLEGKKRVGIAGHIHPDGDCIGSSLAVYNFIRKEFPDIQCHVYLEEIPHIFEFLSNSDMIEAPGTDADKFDLFIILDCGDEKRLGKSAEYMKKASSTICIDHHLSNASFADVNIVKPDASSTCELVMNELEPDKIDKAIAECLYTGMVTDTGCFQYSCTSRSTMECAGILMEKGIDYPAIVDRVFNEKTFEQNRMMGHALDKAALSEDGTVIYSVISASEMKEYNVLPKHMEGIVSQLRVTKGVAVALLMYETDEGTYKGSLRGKGHKINLSYTASLFGGGGHALASGFTYSGDPDAAITAIIKDVRRQLALS